MIDILAYLIRAQNAAVIIRRLGDETIFESFEVSPRASTVMGAKGKLLCSYPGPAIAVPNSVMDNPTFPPELANFLAHMSHDMLDSAPRTTKAHSEVLEKDETAHPRYITELLTGFLRAFGKPADIHRIRKHIGDDVLWSSADRPWRRSSVWLVIRVVLQTSLERTSLGRKGYKFFVASLLKDLVSQALEADLSSDLLYFMSTKITRRLIKLQHEAEDESLTMVLQEATADIKNRLELRWEDVQAAQVDSPHWDVSKMDIIKDTRLSLAESEEYIADVLRHIHLRSSVPNFQPAHRRRGNIEDFLGLDSSFFERAYVEDPFLALFDFECAIECGIDDWVDRALNFDAARINAACLSIQACGTSYSTRAQLSYSKNPENISIMLLTLFELWVALDKLVTKSIPLLKEYSPEVPAAIFDHLLLQKSVAIERLGVLQRYVATRKGDAFPSFSVFSDDANRTTFAVRYYGQSEEMQARKRDIESDARIERAQRIAELHRKSDEYKHLTNEVNTLSCDIFTHWRGWSKHDRDCRRCEKRRDRDNISIEVHEWPLPKDDCNAAVVIFELGAPVTFKLWRSFTIHFLHDACTAAVQPVEKVVPYELLPNYKSLSRYCVEHPAQRITLGSKTASFLASPHRVRSLPCSEEEITVNNGLRFCLYDTANDAWASSPFQRIDISSLCAYELPQGPYNELQCYLSGTQHTSNEVLANQAMCHADLTLHEFIAFGNLRSGSFLQWINILRELRARTLTFRDPAVHFLLLQAALEVGELSGHGSSRVWHDELRNSDFGHALIDELQSLRVSVEANWLEGITMATISVITSRLLSSAEDFSVIQRTYKLLQAIRDTTFKWVQELSKALQDAQDEISGRECQARVRDMAAICRSTYNVDSDNVEALLLSPDDLEALAYCAVTVRDNTPPDLSALPPISRLLLERDRRLSYFLAPHFRRHVKDDQEGLDRAMKRLWPAYQRHTRWTVLKAPNSRWLMCKTAPPDDSSSQTVHLDVLTGRLLVDGKPLTRLPEFFMQDPSYVVLFGHVSFLTC